MDYATAWRAAGEITEMLASTGVKTHAKHQERAADIITRYATTNEKALLKTKSGELRNWLDTLMEDVEKVDNNFTAALPLAAEPETDKMLAGSELNAMVAREVMGWKYSPALTGGPAFWQDPDKNFEAGLISPPFYSTDIVLAIKVAIRLIGRHGCHFDLWSDSSTEWRATFYIPSLTPRRSEPREKRVIGATGTSPSHAICLAAIKAKKAIDEMLRDS